MVTPSHIRIGFIVFLVMMLLVLFAIIYWQHIFHVNTLHLLAAVPLGHIAAGC